MVIFEILHGRKMHPFHSRLRGEKSEFRGLEPGFRMQRYEYLISFFIGGNLMEMDQDDFLVMRITYSF
jgi:hypothetical protein